MVGDAPPSVPRGPGEVPHVRRGRAAGRATEVDPVLQRRHRHHLRGRLLLIQHGPQGGSDPEPPPRGPRPIQA